MAPSATALLQLLQSVTRTFDRIPLRLQVDLELLSATLELSNLALTRVGELRLEPMDATLSRRDLVTQPLLLAGHLRDARAKDHAV